MPGSSNFFDLSKLSVNDRVYLWRDLLYQQLFPREQSRIIVQDCLSSSQAGVLGLELHLVHLGLDTHPPQETRNFCLNLYQALDLLADQGKSLSVRDLFWLRDLKKKLNTSYE
jgi:hypothetical protein